MADSGNCRRRSLRLAAAAAAFALARPALATDIYGVQPAALDQPRINVMIQYPGPAAGSVTDPLYADYGFGTRAFNVDAFFDTGASGVLLSANTAAALSRDPDNSPGIQQATYQGKPVIFQDVGVAGSDNFNVSVPIHVSIAPTSNAAAAKIAAAEEQFNANTAASFAGVDLSAYAYRSGPIRAQIAAPPADENAATADLDVVGTPLMRNRVVVMDPKPVERIFGGDIDAGFQMKTYVYDRGTPFRPATADDDPGIPRTTRTVRLSYGSFDAFTRTGVQEADGSVTPLPDNQAAAYRPTLDHNPFIGPNPVNPAGDATPPVKVAFNGQSASGSFLLDTGAAASMISTTLAGRLAVRITPQTAGTDSPVLETYDLAHPERAGHEIADQFQVTIGGVGGSKKVPGFYLNSMLLKTVEGAAGGDADPRNFRFMDVPVLVNDVSVRTPSGDRTLTLDGIFGMNNLVASVFLAEDPSGGIPGLGGMTPGAFDWAAVDFDEANPTLKLRPRLPGDANRDGTVDFDDLVALAQNYNTDVSAEPWAHADFNGDGVVDFNDLVQIAQHYNASDLAAGDEIRLPQYDLGFGGAVPGAGVPEPSALAVAAIGLVLCRRRAKRA